VLHRLILAAILLTSVIAQDGTVAPIEAGRLRIVRRHEPSFDRYTQAPASERKEWMRRHFWRFSAYSPYFDKKLDWFPDTWLYLDLYAIYKDSPVVGNQPHWILRDLQGNRLYIPWGCSDGSCPQYAGDVSSPEYRDWWIKRAKSLLAKGYKGIWIDDVNMVMRVANGEGTETSPLDPATGLAMTDQNWRRYIAEFVEQIRVELSAYEIVHNSIWFAGPAGVRDKDVYIQRQIAAADYLNCERGIADDGLTGGMGEWSLAAFFSYVDRIHAAEKGVILDDVDGVDREYSIAGYFLISSGRDGFGDLTASPDNWYAGYNLHLGAPLGQRYSWMDVMRRDFSSGMVLLNEPGAPTRTLKLPGTYVTTQNETVTSITLRGRSAAILRHPPM
jgi:hypothetical protein